MKTETNALEIVNRYYEASNKKDANAAGTLMTDDFVFIGPLMCVEGKAANVELLKKFLPMHVEMRIHKQFADGDDVCSIHDLVIRNPAGGKIIMPMAEWIHIRDGKIAKQTIYYDPREFSKAFGMMETSLKNQNNKR